MQALLNLVSIAMKPLVDIFKMLVGDMGVNLRGRYITVSQ